GRSTHIDVRCHFIQDLVRAKAIRIVHVGSEWQHADILTKSLPLTLLKRHRRALTNMGDNK
ncbi:unnamed protein product, partial [Sphacelaria rigidula]